MTTIALRFADNFAPPCGTIVAHQKIIDNLGYVWFGKMGTPISQKSATAIMNNVEPKFLLIHSGKQDRYWAYIEKIQWQNPPMTEIPEYYRDRSDSFKTWFKVLRFEPAPRNVMSKCKVLSSGMPLTETSRHSLCSFFIVSYDDTSEKR